MQAILVRLREPSTYAGLAVLLGLFGVNLAPDVMTTAIQAATGMAALAAVVLREQGR